MQGISAKARLLSVDASQSNPPGCPKRAEGTHRAAGTSLLPKAKTSHHRFCAQDSFVFSPRKNRPKYGRFFVVWIYCFLLNNALLTLLFFVEQCFDCGNKLGKRFLLHNKPEYCKRDFTSQISALSCQFTIKRSASAEVANVKFFAPIAFME